MSWLDFFRHKIPPEEENEEVKRICLTDLSSELEIEIKDISEGVKAIKETVKQRVSAFNREIEGHIQKLKGIDLKDRREEERIKVLVLENLKFYISYLQHLNEGLESLDSKSEDYFKKINYFFDDFQRKSINSFEKARILIGKELADVRSSVKVFSEDVNKIISSGRQLFDKEKTANMLSSILLSLQDERNGEVQIESSMESLKHSLKDLEEKKSLLEKEIEAIKNTEEYRKNLEEKEKTNREKEAVEKELLSFREEINIKALLRHFHQDKKKNDLLKKYSDNFKEALENDERLEIAALVRELKPEFNEERIRQIRDKKNRLKDLHESQIDSQIKDMEAEIMKTAVKLAEFKEEELQEKNKKEKICSKIANTLQEIKKQSKILWHNKELIE